MAIWMDRSTSTFTHMGGEGVPWIGQAPFTDEQHIFANLGDGTYYHSGILAIRAAVAAGVNITYKILYNDAVAMTGGQPVDGPLSPADIARQVAAEGVKRVVVVSDEPDKYADRHLPPAPSRSTTATSSTPSSASCATIAGCTVLLYDQTCAAEKRRRRKRGKLPDPARRVVINDLVCEGCGDCGVASNCVSVAPLETEFGRKRAHRPELVQQGLLLHQGLLPQLRHRRGRAPAGNPRKPAAASSPTLPEPEPAGTRRALRHPGHRHRRHRRGHHRRAARHGRPPRGQGRRRSST